MLSFPGLSHIPRFIKAAEYCNVLLLCTRCLWPPEAKLLVLAPAPQGVNAVLPQLPREPRGETWTCQRSHFIWESRLWGCQLRGSSQIKSQDRVSQCLCSHFSGSLAQAVQLKSLRENCIGHVKFGSHQLRKHFVYLTPVCCSCGIITLQLNVAKMWLIHLNLAQNGFGRSVKLNVRSSHW